MKSTDSVALRSLPWALLGAAGWLFMYADRAVLSPLLQTFGGLFHVGPEALGLISTVFFLTYTAVQIPAGYIADRVSPRLLLGTGYVGFGIFITLIASSTTYPALLVFSGLAGLFQGVYYPTQFAVTARRIQPTHLPLANSVITAGMGVGISVGYVLASVLGAGGWQRPVWILGLLTITLGAVLWVVTPRAIPAARQGTAAPVAWRGRFGWLLAINFCSLYGFFFLLAWLPYYLNQVERLHGLSLGFFASWPTLLAVPATILWSRAARDATTRLARLRGLLGVAALSLVLIPLTGNGAVVLLGLTLYGISGKLVLDPLVLSETAADIAAPSYGKAFGVLNFVGMLASIAAPSFSGWLIERTGGFAACFDVAAALLLGGWLAALRLSRPARIA